MTSIKIRRNGEKWRKMNTIKINNIEWEEITEEEYDNLPNNETMCCGFDDETENIYFKKKGTFPIVFKHQGWENRRFEVDEDGDIHFIPNENDEFVFENYRGELELLYKAVEKSKELRK